jgi:hypothetical protein
MVFQKGHRFYPGGEKGWFGTRPPWNKGIKLPIEKIHKHTLEAKQKISKSKLELYKNKTKHPSYQFGISYSNNYGRIHMWLKETFGEPDKCKNKDCSKISTHKEYKPIRSNFIMLCRSCHMKMDKQTARLSNNK